jgi:hypothetical protein
LVLAKVLDPDPAKVLDSESEKNLVLDLAKVLDPAKVSDPA